MQIVTLQQIKDQFNVTFSSADAKLTKDIEDVEGAILQYCGVGSVEEIYAMFGEDVAAVALSALERAVIVGTQALWEDPGANIWTYKGSALVRLLLPYRVPAISGGTTA